MKNIKILETIVVCLISTLLLSFAVVQEKNSQTTGSSTVALQQARQSVQTGVAVLHSASTRGPLSNVISFISFSKVILSVAALVVVVSLAIIIVGLLFYVQYSIRP